MRLQRLDLTRYGRFTDHVIDFGKTDPGSPDLHIIYGPNEAGKSTAFAAFLDLLFGIGAQSPYNFLHPYPTMRIGGVLELADGTREFVRIKKPQNSLLDGAGRPMLDSAIQVDVGGIDRDAYRTMFSLDDETLERGGDSILASKGDLGELLFSAGTGLADLSRKLIDLRLKADQFYKYRARTGVLAELKSRLSDLKTERDGFDTLASDYARLIEARNRTTTQYDSAIVERAQVHARIDAIQRQLNALPRLLALRTYQDRLAPLSGLPDAPAAWGLELPSLRREEIELGVRQQAIAETIALRAREIEEVIVDENALALADLLAALSVLKARDTTAEKDLPDRRLRLREAEHTITGILVRLEQQGEPEPARLILGASTIGRLRALIEFRAGIDAALRGANAELTDAKRAVAEAEEALRQAGCDEAVPLARDPIAALATTVASVRASDHPTRRRLAERTDAAMSARLAERLKTLAPWSGDADDLVGMHCPTPSMLQDWKAELERAQSAILRYATEIDALTTEVGTLEAVCDGVARTTGLVSDQQAATVRGRREQAWANHRRDLNAASGDAFEAALREDDVVTSGRLGHASDLATLQQSERALAIATAKRTHAADLKAAAESSVKVIQEAITRAIRTMAPLLDQAMHLSELEAWLARRGAALADREAVVEAQTEFRHSVADEQAARDRLVGALIAAGAPVAPKADFDTLYGYAQDIFDRDAGIRTLRERITERRSDLNRRERVLLQTQENAAEWSASWTAACRGCWLREAGDELDIATVREIIAIDADLGPALEKKAGLADRVGKMEKDRQDFRAGIVALAERLDIPVEGHSTEDLDQGVSKRIRDATTQSERRAKLLDALASERETERALTEAKAVHRGRTGVMTAHFGVTSLDEVSEKLLDVAKRTELREQTEIAEREILEGLGVPGIAEAESVLNATDRPALDTESAALRARYDDLNARCESLFAERSQAIDRVEAIGGDSKVAEIEEHRRTTLLEIEEGAARYLHLRAGTLATEFGLRAYRDRHRSSMMTRASEAFGTISRGTYRGLATQPAKDGDTLIALSAAGGSKAAYDLSKGTRFQLYLALRVAGYHEFIRTRQPVPFIADDIMETFDDFRAEEAFRLFTEMAVDGQVIYLTHHRHLCDIALTACPSAKIHYLNNIIKPI